MKPYIPRQQKDEIERLEKEAERNKKAGGKETVKRLRKMLSQ